MKLTRLSPTSRSNRKSLLVKVSLIVGLMVLVAVAPMFLILGVSASGTVKVPVALTVPPMELVTGKVVVSLMVIVMVMVMVTAMVEVMVTVSIEVSESETVKVVLLVMRMVTVLVKTKLEVEVKARVEV